MKKSSFCLIFGQILLLLFLTFHKISLSAQNELPDSLVTVQLQYLKKSLNQDKNRTQIWWYGWLSGYSAATIGQGILYSSTDDKSLRQDMTLGAATTLLGVAGQFVGQIHIGNETERLSMLKEGTNSERMQKMVIAEQLLEECARREQLARSWKNHALTGAVNLGGGLITWLGFKRNIGAGIGYFVLNTFVTEAQIWSQPTIAKRSYHKYRRKYQEKPEDISYVPCMNWYLETYPGGIGLKVVF